MKKTLIFMHKKYGHKEATTTAATLAEDKDTAALFEEIMTEGYGGKVPPVFHVTYKDGSTKRLEGDEARVIMDDNTVTEAAVIAPLVGG